MARKAGKEEWKTYGDVFDESTLRTLFKLESQGYFDRLLSPVKVGKESNVFSAVKGDEIICVKIYRVNTCDFKKMYSYIYGDERFPKLTGRRGIIYAWAQREYMNLLRCFQSGVSVPKPIAVANNILVMEFINGKPAVDSQIIKKFSLELVREIVKMHKCGIVHGDLSEFNIMNNGKPVIIDLSHGVRLNHPRARELLERDIVNVARFLNEKGFKCSVSDIMGKLK